ncbi:MAG: hypothetical protein JW991_02335 [Candidatus Pacebacteria bacterium]|nr:hypothetical protein [Candidatus Paceibacterota bacterium]
MKFWKKILPLLLFFIFLTGLFKEPASASEGYAELRGATDENGRCFAFSTFMDDNLYHILISCRNLRYPPDAEHLVYSLWVSQSDGGGLIKLGNLGQGKLGTNIAPAFNNFYITKERDAATKEPTGPTVMSGTVRPLVFLQSIEVVEPTRTPTEPNSEIPTGTEPLQISEEGEKKSGLFKGSTLLPALALISVTFLMIFLVRRKK